MAISGQKWWQVTQLGPFGTNANRSGVVCADHISALCMRERIHPMHKKVDGAVITSQSENSLDCTITFQTDTILQRFMLRFEKLALDCDDHLFIYDGAHAIGNHKVIPGLFANRYVILTVCHPRLTFPAAALVQKWAQYSPRAVSLPSSISPIRTAIRTMAFV